MNAASGGHQEWKRIRFSPYCLAGADDPLPGLHVCGRIAREREDAAFERAAEEGRVAVEDELLAFGADLTQAEAHRALVIGLVALEAEGEFLEDGIELVPGLGLLIEHHLNVGGAAFPEPTDFLALAADRQGAVACLAARIADAHLHGAQIAWPGSDTPARPRSRRGWWRGVRCAR